MCREGECKWTGATGTRYKYVIFPLPCRFQRGQHGSYVYTRRDKQGRWVPIYFGEGDLGQCCSPDHPRYRDIMARRATHFHCHLSLYPEVRAEERDDLLARYLNAFEPYGCNRWDENTVPAEVAMGGAGEFAATQ